MLKMNFEDCRIENVIYASFETTYTRFDLEFAILTHLSRMYFPIFINWTSPFPILGLLGGIFHFHSKF